MGIEKPKPFVVILTGGIASGKTAVSDLFKALGAPVIDTDLIARDVVLPGSPLLREIAKVFGRRILLEDGALNRSALRDIIFSDDDSRKRLEQLMHPAILSAAEAALDKVNFPYCIVVIPLLAEQKLAAWGDRVLVVDVAVETQLKRLMARDQVSRNQAMAALAAQADRKTRLSIADDVIVNETSFSALKQHVDALHRRYLDLGNQRAHEA